MYYIVLFHFRTRSIFWRWCWWCHAIPSLLIQQDKACNFQASCIKHIVTKMTQNILANSILIWFYKKWFFVISTLVFRKYVCMNSDGLWHVFLQAFLWSILKSILPVFDQIKHQQIRWILALLCLEITKQNVTICLRRQ